MTPEPEMKKNIHKLYHLNTEQLLGRIGDLENAARCLEPNAKERERIANQALGYVEQFLESISNSKAYIGGDCKSLRSLTVDDRPKPFGELLNLLKDEVNQTGINSSSGTGFAYVPSGGIWASSIADMLAAATNRYAGVYFSSPGAVIIENQMVRWLCSIVGYPATAHGNLTSGGSIANLTAMQSARDTFKINSTNVGKAVVYFTEHAHHCIHKAIHILGLDEATQRIIPIDSRYRMNVAALDDTMKRDKGEGLRPFLVIATAGTTDTGAIDPLDSIADTCSEHGAWLHVDAAYGGFFILLDQLAGKFKGIERSDSLVMDPHKGMFLPFGIGAVLVKDGRELVNSNSLQAPYMQDALVDDELSPADSGIELTRHFRGLRMWLPLHLHGVAAFRANLAEKIFLSRYFHDEIAKLGFDTGPEPELSITLFRFPAGDGDDLNRRLLDAIRTDGRVVFSSTMINGEFWIRCAILSFRSHLREVRLALEVIEEKLKQLSDQKQCR